MSFASAPTESGQELASAKVRWWRHLKIGERALAYGVDYVLAAGAFYLSYRTLYGLALKVGFSAGSSEAYVAAFLADLGVFAYSWKAISAAEDGRRTWGINLMVLALASASIALNIHDSWPNPWASTYHALPPVLWIGAHFSTLQAKWHAVKKQRRAQQAEERQKLIEQGILPAPVPRLRRAQVLLAPLPMFKVKRVMWFSGCDARTAARFLIAQAQAADESIPLAWRFLVVDDPMTDLLLPPSVEVTREPEAPAVNTTLALAGLQLTPAPVKPALTKTQNVLPAAVKAPKQIVTVPIPPQKPPADQRLSLGLVGADGKTALTRLPKVLQDALLTEIPERRGSRSVEDTVDLAVKIHDICADHGQKCTGALLALVLGVAPSYISQTIKKPMEDKLNSLVTTA
ncbi:DUF2637 domain-containing protein [Kitasatospora viridis]|uniref:DUF2637 domain-containing protein n=1 Tax=Kitasatospora viridis TaxID=281105 RepID=UPI0011A086B1|nr:DUF2637 domain-containing protein [Kitasatospora viridis]